MNIVEREIADGIKQVYLDNFLIRALGKLGGYPYAVSYLIDGEVLVDAGIPWATKAMTKYFREAAPMLKWIVVTHGHEDHFGTAAAIAEAVEARVVCHRLAIAKLAHPEEVKWYRSFLFGPIRPVAAEACPPSLTTKRRSLQIIPTPGHTPDHVVVYDPTSATLFSGDLFLDEEVDAQLSDADGPTWLESIKLVLELDINRLADGHGTVLDGSDARQALINKLAFMETLKSAVEAQIRNGPCPMKQIVSATGPKSLAYRVSLNEGRLSMLTGNDFSRTHLVQTFVEQAVTADA